MRPVRNAAEHSLPEQLKYELALVDCKLKPLRPWGMQAVVTAPHAFAKVTLPVVFTCLVRERLQWPGST